MSETYSITPMDLGRCIREKQNFTYAKGVGQEIELLVASYLIRGNNHTILVDTGGPPDPSLTTPWHLPFIVGPEQTMSFQLSKYGVSPEDVDIIIFTHLHWDHVYNVELFKKAHFFVTKREHDYALNPLFWLHEKYYDSPNVGFKAPWRDLDFHYTSPEQEIVPGIEVFSTPGHSIGHQSVAVETDQGRFILAGDLIPLFENWEERNPSGMIFCFEDYFNSFKRIEEKGGTVIASHDLKSLEYVIPRA